MKYSRSSTTSLHHLIDKEKEKRRRLRRRPYDDMACGRCRGEIGDPRRKSRLSPLTMQFAAESLSVRNSATQTEIVTKRVWTRWLLGLCDRPRLSRLQRSLHRVPKFGATDDYPSHGIPRWRERLAGDQQGCAKPPIAIHRTFPYTIKRAASCVVRLFGDMTMHGGKYACGWPPMRRPSLRFISSTPDFSFRRSPSSLSLQDCPFDLSLFIADMILLQDLRSSVRDFIATHEPRI